MKDTATYIIKVSDNNEKFGPSEGYIEAINFAVWIVKERERAKQFPTRAAAKRIIERIGGSVRGSQKTYEIIKKA